MNNGQTPVHFGYDPLGRLFNVNATWGPSANPALRMNMLLHYDGVNLIAETNGDNGTLARRYVHGPGVDEPIVWYEGAGTADRRWLLPDERGSIIAVTDSTGNAMAINRYDEYGIPAATNMGRFQYTGQAWMPEVGLYYYKARMYSPTLGRFMQTDPIGYADGMNWYNYVGSDPVNKTDPWGLRQKCVGLENPDGSIKFDCGEAPSDILPPGSIKSPVVKAAPAKLPPQQQPQSDEPSTLEKLGQCTSDQLGLGELAEAAAVASGQPIPGTKPFVTPGSSRGTSAAGMAADKLLGKTRLPVRLPTIVGGPGTGRALAIAGTKSAARFAGRAVPIVGWALLAYDAASIAICTASSE